MEDNNNVNAAILERLEKVVSSLQENSVKMGQLLAVHNEKLDKQDRIDAVLFEKIEQVVQKLDRHATDIKKGCERDILLVGTPPTAISSFNDRIVSITLCNFSFI